MDLLGYFQWSGKSGEEEKNNSTEVLDVYLWLKSRIKWVYMSGHWDEREHFVEEMVDHAKELLLIIIGGEKIQNNIHNPVCKLRLVLQSNLFESRRNYLLFE